MSVSNALDALGGKAKVSGDADEIARADKLILPGVGAFGECMKKLREHGIDEAVKAAAAKGTPLLGEGLGLLAGSVTKLKSGGLPLPHIAWTSIDVHGGGLLSGIESGEFFYFVHSYCAHAGDKRDEAASAEYGETFTAAAERDNVFGVQFHPEKSGARGLAILKNFMGI